MKTGDIGVGMVLDDQAPESRARHARIAKDQRNRSRLIGVAGANYLAGALGLGMYAWAGTVSWMIPAGFLGISMTGTAFFWLLVHTGRNLHAPDPNLFGWQMGFAALVLLGHLAAVPELAFVWLSSLFVTAVFGLIQFSMRQSIVALLVCGAGAAAVFALANTRLALPASSPLEVALLWLFLMIALARFAVVASHVSLLRVKLREKNELLMQSMRRVQELADHDELTGALMRRRFVQALEHEIVRSERSAEGFCVVILDVDLFKKVNDDHGHLTGDRVLRQLCETLRPVLRAGDQFGRYGGEEFVLMLPALAPEDAPALVGRIGRALSDHPWDEIAPGLRVTASFGVTAWRHGDDVQTLLNRADSALYQAKANGRDRAEYAFGNACGEPAGLLSTRVPAAVRSIGKTMSAFDGTSVRGTIGAPDFH